MKTLEELQVGKWYTSQDWYIGSFAKLSSNSYAERFYFSESIRSSTWSINSGWWGFKSISYLREVSLEEIQQYLPDGHPDKIVEKSLVGRYVKCLEDGANYCPVAKEEVKEGEYYKIDSIEINNYKLKDGNYCGYVNKPDSQFKDIGFELMPEGFTPSKESFKTNKLPTKSWY